MSDEPTSPLFSVMQRANQLRDERDLYKKALGEIAGMKDSLQDSEDVEVLQFYLSTIFLAVEETLKGQDDE